MDRLRPVRLDPFLYTDYRAYLADYVSRTKARRPQWSYTVWAKQLGLRSSSTLIMIVNGQRNPGPSLLRGFSRFFGFSEAETRYFGDLVRLAKASRDVKLSLSILEQLEKRNPGRGFKRLDPDAFQAISQWYPYVLREMTALRGFSESPARIARQLAFFVSPERVGAALETLVRLGLLARDPRGRLGTQSVHLDTQSDVADEGLKRFHEQSLENARRALRETDPAEREISGGCFAIRLRDLPRAKELIRKFQVQLCHEVETVKDADEVYQLEVAFYPVTRMRRSHSRRA